MSERIVLSQESYRSWRVISPLPLHLPVSFVVLWSGMLLECDVCILKEDFLVWRKLQFMRSDLVSAVSSPGLFFHPLKPDAPLMWRGIPKSPGGHSCLKKVAVQEKWSRLCRFISRSRLSSSEAGCSLNVMFASSRVEDEILVSNLSRPRSRLFLIKLWVRSWVAVGLSFWSLESNLSKRILNLEALHVEVSVYIRFAVTPMCGVSWPSGSVHPTRALVFLSQQRVGFSPSRNHCVLKYYCSFLAPGTKKLTT